MITRIILVVAMMSLIIYGLNRLIKKIITFFTPFTRPTPSQASSENLVACNRCQIFIPQSQAVKLNNSYFCCQEHADLA